MNEEELLRDIHSLPFEAQREVEDLVHLLWERYQKPSSTTATPLDLESEAFVGMWRDRDDMRDSSAWIRNIREMGRAH